MSCSFASDILSAQPDKLFRAWMAEFRTPFFRSYLVNQPDLVSEILKGDRNRFPKSERVGVGLSSLLGRSVFLTNGADWARQRRIIDPAFAQSGVQACLPAMTGAGRAMVARLPVGRPVDSRSRSQPCHGGRDLSHTVFDADRNTGGARGIHRLPGVPARAHRF